MKSAFAIGLLIVAGCAGPPAPQESSQGASPPESSQAAPQPSATPGSVAVSRADALLADLEKREADTKKLADDYALRALQIPVVTEPGAKPSPAPEHPRDSGTLLALEPRYGGRNEAWWRSQMALRVVRLQNSVLRFNAALAALKSTMNQANGRGVYNRAESDALQLRAIALSDRAEVERFRETARRLNVPPGWLRP
jgi:hypothetical protein